MKAGRRRAREFILQALYAADAGAVPGPAALAGVWSAQLDELSEPLEEPVTTDETDFAQEVVRGVLEDRDGLDLKIEAASEHWRVARMPVVDRNIIRMGAFEIMSRPDIPASVAINEAVEIAKKYGGAESKAFVNGLLDRIAKEVGRGGRR